MVVLLAVVIMWLRVCITPRLINIPTFEGTYEAFAHLFVGFLILIPFYDCKDALGPASAFGWLGWILALWEAFWFILQKAYS